MSLHVQCNTDQAILLLAIQCPDGLLRFPNDEAPLPGLRLKVQPQLGINEQLIARAQQDLTPALASQISIWQNYSDVVTTSSQESVTFYVGILRPTSETLDTFKSDWKEWRTLPDLIRSLPKDRTRLTYLKAWQVLTGALEETTKALDVDEVARYLKSIETPKS